MSDLDLSSEQQHIKSVFLSGQSLFLTGAAGTGKTHLIRDLIQSTARKEPEKLITALTGCAAILIHENAKTLASWAGIGIANEDDDKIIERIKKHKMWSKNWRRCQVLFVDEVSMLSKRVFELLDKTAKGVRNCDLPFGGMQIVFSGDFFQLPPISEGRDAGTFCFKSDGTCCSGRINLN